MGTKKCPKTRQALEGEIKHLERKRANLERYIEGMRARMAGLERNCRHHRDGRLDDLPPVYEFNGPMIPPQALYEARHWASKNLEAFWQWARRMQLFACRWAEIGPGATVRAEYQGYVLGAWLDALGTAADGALKLEALFTDALRNPPERRPVTKKEV